MVHICSSSWPWLAVVSWITWFISSENKVTVVKPEQIYKMTIIFTVIGQKLVRNWSNCHFFICSAFAIVIFLSALDESHDLTAMID